MEVPLPEKSPLDPNNEAFSGEPGLGAEENSELIGELALV
jgi:hypothetical protein